MSLLSFLKYSAREKKYAEVIQQWFTASGYSNSEAKKLSYELLDKCIDEAEQQGLRNVTDLGDQMVSTDDFMSKRLVAGLTIEDVRNAWNDGYIWVRLQEEASNVCNFPFYKHLVEQQGLSPKEAVLKMRTSMPYFGDPETSHPDYQGKDADIYFEFRRRFDIWRENYSTEDIGKMLKKFSTYNAMIRHYIKKGEI